MHGAPGRQHRPLRHGALGEAAGRGLDDLEVGDDALADAVDLHQPRRRGGEHLGEGAEAPDQLLGDRLHVAARDRAEQHELQQLVIRQGVAAHLREARPQPVAVAVVMGIVASMMGQIRRIVGAMLPMMMRVIPTMMRIVRG